MDAAVRMAAASCRSLMLLGSSTIPATGFNEMPAFFLRTSYIPTEMDFSTPRVLTDLSLPMSLPPAWAMGSAPGRCTIFVSTHSFCACSMYRLSVSRINSVLVTMAQLSPPAKPVR